ncbi:MAG: SDR family oxidoreductase [Trueperaceae bacterium]|nr:SDR family oxidoreductase [Trueperaceae bacterium]
MAYLITGSMGCLGAWAIYHLTKAGKKVISFDLSENRHRLNLLMSPEEQESVTFLKGDLTNFEQVLKAITEHEVKHIIHLAALQVPFCRANPVLGAQVNVVGTVNVFEAAKQAGLKHLACASSIAVYGPPEVYGQDNLPADAPLAPTTLYGVYKQANEGTARVYFQDYGLSSTSLRPYTVYGVGRDQGLTSEPSKAMLAAAAGKDFEISFGGKMQFHLASDVARQFIEAAETPLNGAYGFNLGLDAVAVTAVAQMIESVKPGVTIRVKDTHLPFAESMAAGDYKKHLSGTSETPLELGIRQTIAQFEQLLQEGKVSL